MKPIIFALCTVLSLFLMSCTSEINIISTDKGVEFSFNGVAQKGFEKLIKSLGAENQNFIDSVQITDELTKAGFSAVDVKQKNLADLSIFMTATNKNNFLFESGVVVMENNIYKTDFSRDKLKAFYEKADAQVIQVMDLLLAPVFNDEEMTVEEYLEVIAAFYGDSVAEELKTSKVKVISKGWAKNYSLPEILCGYCD